MGNKGIKLVILLMFAVMGFVACSSSTPEPVKQQEITPTPPATPTPTPSPTIIPDPPPPPPPKTLKDIVEGQGNANLTSNNMDLVVAWTGGLIDASYTQARKLFDKAFEKSIQNITEPTDDTINLNYKYEELGSSAEVKGLVQYFELGAFYTEYTVLADYQNAVLDTNYTLNGSSSYHEKADVTFLENGESKGDSHIILDGLFSVSGVIGAKIDFVVSMTANIKGGNFELVKISGTANVESGGNHFTCTVYGEPLKIKKPKLDENGQPVMKFDAKSQTNVIEEVEETLAIQQPMIQCEAK